MILHEEPPIPKVLRGDEVVALCDGKGVDIGRVFNTLDFDDYCCLSIVGGVVGRIIREQCAAEGIRSKFFEISGNSRINTALVYESRKDLLMINEPGPEMTRKEVEGFLEFFKASFSSGDTLVISGSAPVGFTPDDLERLVLHALSVGSEVKVDIAGIWLEKLLEVPLATLKLNNDEFQHAFGIRAGDVDRMWDFKQKHQIDDLIITEGNKGSTAYARDGARYRSLLQRATSNIGVGSGDSFFAGLLYGEAQNMSFQESLHLANACGYANTFHYGAGIFEYADIESVRDRVTVERIE